MCIVLSFQILKKDGYTVSVVQDPTLSLADDVAAAHSYARRPARPYGRAASADSPAHPASCR
jgi:hypothetical protein